MPSLLAINAKFSVAEENRKDFLTQLHAEATLQQQKQRQELPELIQFVLGEDSEKIGTFYMHLKYQVIGTSSNSSDTNSMLQQLAQSAAKNIFAKETNSKWRQFITEKQPFLENPVINLWTVAPVPIEAKVTDANSLNNNPKQNVPKDTPIFCLNADLHPHPDYRDKLLALLENARANSIREPLCVEYQFGESISSPNTFHVHQEYRGDNGGKEGFDKHAKTAHYQQWKEFVNKHEQEAFTKKPMGYRYQAVVGSTKLPNEIIHHKTQRVTKRRRDQDVLLLDGGSGHELKERGVNDGSFLAGLLANEKQSDIVESMHRDFYKSGCQVVTTNSFVAVPDRLLQEGLVSDIQAAKERTRQLIAAAVQNAKKAVCGEVNNSKSNQPVGKVAGSLPPVTECYMASAVPTVDEMMPAYQFLISTLIELQVDILLAETLSTTREALAILQATASVTKDRKKQQEAPGTPLWISMTIDDFNQPTTLRSGEPLEEALQSILKEAKRLDVQLEAIGVNCTSPIAITRALPSLVTAANNGIIRPPPRVLAYGNAFQKTTSEWLASLLDSNAKSVDDVTNSQNSLASISGSGDYDKSGCILPDVYARHTKEWVELGASIIGGCCGVSPLHMQTAANALSTR